MRDIRSEAQKKHEAEVNAKLLWEKTPEGVAMLAEAKKSTPDIEEVKERLQYYQMFELALIEFSRAIANAMAWQEMGYPQWPEIICRASEILRNRARQLAEAEQVSYEAAFCSLMHEIDHNPEWDERFTDMRAHYINVARKDSASSETPLL